MRIRNWMLGVVLAFVAGVADAASCHGYCRCGTDTYWACFQECGEGWSALCTDGSCGAFIAGCCCQQFRPGGGVNYFCVEKTCGIRFTKPLLSSVPPLPEDKGSSVKQRPQASVSQEEQWAYLEYEVGAERKVINAKVRHTSSPEFGETLVQEMLGSQRSHFSGPGNYRSFELRPPQGHPGFGDERRLTEASRLLKVALPQSVPENGVFAWRLELGRTGELIRQAEVFSTTEGLSNGLEIPLERFLDESGLREAGEPLVIFLVYQIEQQRIVSVGVSNYLME